MMVCKFRADFGKYNDGRYSSYEFDTVGKDIKQCYVIAVSRVSAIADVERFDLLGLHLLGLIYEEEEDAII